MDSRLFLKSVDHFTLTVPATKLGASLKVHEAWFLGAQRASAEQTAARPAPSRAGQAACVWSPGSPPRSGPNWWEPRCRSEGSGSPGRESGCGPFRERVPGAGQAARGPGEDALTHPERGQRAGRAPPKRPLRTAPARCNSKPCRCLTSPFYTFV